MNKNHIKNTLKKLPYLKQVFLERDQLRIERDRLKAERDQSQRLVAQEIRYDMPEAGEVFLVWRINGWRVVPEENRPARTMVKDAVMHTQMARIAPRSESIYSRG